MVDVVLAPMPAVRVTGIAIGPREALTGLTLRLLPKGAEDLGIGSELATSGVAPDGAFTLLNVPAGMYVIDASRATGAFTLPMDFVDDASQLAMSPHAGVRTDVSPGAGRGPIAF